MAETEPAGTGSSSHVVVDIDDDVEAVAAFAAADGGEAAATTRSSSPCVVCMEPMEWVAVYSPCGHREVWARCAARVRFANSDRRCCICRAHCATVVVTRASAARGVLPSLSPPPAAASFGGQGMVVGVNCWYHGGMGAYFDDVSQFQEMSKVCTAAAPPSSEESGGGGAAGSGSEEDDDDDDDDRPLSRENMAAFVVVGVCGALMLGAPLLYLIPT